MPQATLTLLSCSPNFLPASITRYTHAKHEPILKFSAFAFVPSELILSLTLIPEWNFLRSFSFLKPDYIGNIWRDFQFVFLRVRTVIQLHILNSNGTNVAISNEVLFLSTLLRTLHQEAYQTNRTSFLTVWRKQQELDWNYFCCSVIIACSMTKTEQVPNVEKETSISLPNKLSVVRLLIRWVLTHSFV